MSNEYIAMPTYQLDYTSDEILKVIRNTLAPTATDAEFMYFIEYCKSTGLNPIKKEIWFIKTNSYTNKRGERVDGKVQIMTGINGFYAIANRSPQYDGMEETTVERDENGKILRATAKVWRKDRRFPSTATVEFSEFAPEIWPNQKPGIWETKSTVMICKVAESHALRKGFPQELNGLATMEEMPVEYAYKNPLDVTPKKEPRTVTVKREPKAIEHKPIKYYIPAPTPEQFQFLEKNKMEQESDYIWVTTQSIAQNVSKKLDLYLYTEEMEQKENEIEADTLPDNFTSLESNKDKFMAELDK